MRDLNKPHKISKDNEERRYKEKHCIIAGKLYFCNECNESTWKECIERCFR